MKIVKFAILSLLFSYLGFTQETKQDFYKRSFIAYEGCEDSEDLERCYEISFHEFLAKHLNRKALKDSIFFKAEKDTVTVSASILYDENGKVVKRHSRISNPASNRIEGLKYLLDSIPTVKPVLDKKNNGVALNTRKLFGFYLNKVKDTIVPIFGYTPSEVPYEIIEKVPVYRGCDESMSNEDLKNCMNEKVSQLISENFRTNPCN